MVFCSKAHHDSILVASVENYMILVLVLFLVMSVCRFVVPAWSEWVALGLMICAGIPHGSFDLRVAEAKWREGGISRTAILTGYLVCVVGMSSMCVFTPLAGLLLFLVISAIHFSEGESHSSQPPDVARGILFGVSAIVLPIGLHLSNAQSYVSFFIPPALFFFAQGSLRFIASALACVIAIVLLRDLLCARSVSKSESLQRLVCFCGWIFLPPLAGFAVWFVGRHSRQHLEVCEDMFARSGVRIPLDFAIISACAILGLAPFAVLFDFSDINQLFAASISLIAGLTLPHMIVSHRIRDVLPSSGAC
jgi:Brp/Blh family beta-carotene 15,15'-monooxygenase